MNYLLKQGSHKRKRDHEKEASGLPAAQAASRWGLTQSPSAIFDCWGFIFAHRLTQASLGRLFAKISPGTPCQGFVASSGIEPESRASETRILSVVLRGH